MRRGWTIDPVLEGRRGKSGGVQCVCSHDITKDGVKDVLVGRTDGGVEVWSFDTGPQPQLVFERALQESVTAVDCGLITNPNFEEVLVTTYSGKLISFSSEPSSGGHDDATGGGAQAGRGGGGKERRERGERKIRGLRDEIDKLRERVERSRTEVSRASPDNPSGIGSEVQFAMNHRWSLNPDEARYELNIELSTPIDTVLLQCDVPVELLDAELDAAIVSRTPNTSSGLLATFRCQDRANRLELCVRTSEGRYGNLYAYVWPRISPKTCQLASFHIKPLSLHTRMQSSVVEGELAEMNSLTITGSFKLVEVHSWVVACLPEVPARLQTESASFAFRNTFLDTLLLADYREGEANFRSDSLTTLAIVKEVVTKQGEQTGQPQPRTTAGLLAPTRQLLSTRRAKITRAARSPPRSAPLALSPMCLCVLRPVHPQSLALLGSSLVLVLLCGSQPLIARSRSRSRSTPRKPRSRLCFERSTRCSSTSSRWTTRSS